MLSCFFKVFKAFLVVSRIKWSKLGLFGTTHGTRHYFLYFIVLNWLESKTIVICLKLGSKFRFLRFVERFFAVSRIKWFKLGLFDTKLGTQHYLVYIIVLNWLESRTIFISFTLHAKLVFLRFLSVFVTFLHKVVQTWFVWHEP